MKWRSLLALALVACAAATTHVADTARKPDVAPRARQERKHEQEQELSVPLQTAIDTAVQGAIARSEIPGAVVAVVNEGGLVWQRAYGARSQEPERKPMTTDTFFDLASLTKPIVTATSIMLLVEDHQLSLDDPVAKHLPAFAERGKAAVTVRHLLEHTSGLTAANSLADYRGGRERAIARVMALPLDAPAGRRRVYSDVGYIVLGELVAKISGESLEAFARRRIFEPLGMSASFTPKASRTAPTERAPDGSWLRGSVHDPRAAALGGTAGHAGLFGTAADVAAFVAMLLGKGSLLARESIAALTRPTSHGHALGYQLAAGGFGHTGFTGTSLWIEPRIGVGVVLLTSRLHPDGKGDVTRLRRELSSIVARASVLTGIDVLVSENFAPLRGRRVGLVTNATGRTRAGRSTIEVLREAPGVELVSLFSPEHGIRGGLDRAVPDAVDGGLPVHSLYGKNLRPTAAQLRGIDTLVFDVQDAGARFYTYITTLGYLLEAAAKHKLRVVVLDRPNPVGGALVEGPLLDRDRESFIGYHPLPVRHGLTVGELAKLFNEERRIGADLQVIAMRGWSREQLFDDTGLQWVDPSPNLRSARAALLYPGIGMLEAGALSVGRGTDRPFEQIGAPWLDAERLQRKLAGLGVRVTLTHFVPSSSTFSGQRCDGVAFEVIDPHRFESVRFGVAIAHALFAMHPKEWRADRLITHIANRRALDALLRGASREEIAATWRDDLAAFATTRSRYLLY